MALTDETETRRVGRGTKPKRTWPSPRARKDAYMLMATEYWRTLGQGFVEPERDGRILSLQESIDFSTRRERLYLSYTSSAYDRLHAMCEIAALIEDKPIEQVLRTVRGY